MTRPLDLSAPVPTGEPAGAAAPTHEAIAVPTAVPPHAGNAVPITELLPHAGDAVLLDAVLRADADSIVACATVRRSELYSDPDDGALPPWLGLEFMAQAIAAWAGCQARRAGDPVRPGFLLGTRHYECQLERFTPGLALTVHAARSLHDANGMGIFDCELHAAGTIVASARLSVYRPTDNAAADAVLRGDRRA